jgi:hypothetical protein
MSFPFFFGTIIIDDNQIDSSIDCMKLATSNLSIFCLTIVAYFGFNLYMAWCVSGMVVSNSIQCWANFGGMPFKSLIVRPSKDILVLLY